MAGGSAASGVPPVTLGCPDRFMPSQRFSRTKPPAPPGDGTHYVFKPSLAGGARQFELTGEGLRWRSTKSHLWPWQRIAMVRLSYRPASMQPWRFRADIRNADGQRVTLVSTTWHSIAQMARQDDDYRAFIVELHRRLAQAGAKVELVAGIHPLLFAAGFAVMVLIGIALAGLLLRALMSGQFAAALFMAGFAAWFGWQIGSFLRRNRPRRYSFEALPPDVLP
jgi:hypothetical protein